VSVLIFFLAGYLLTCLTLTKLFQKVGVAPSKAWIPGVNMMEWCDLIGKPRREALWLLFPIVGFFTWSGMAVDLARSFGYTKFWHAALAVIFAPIIFFIIGRNPKATYKGKILDEEAAYMQKMQDAYVRKDNIMLKRLERENPYQKGALREWTEALVFAVFAAAFIRMFLIEAYVIPSSSMEGSLKIGDYLFVSKWHYGIRTPQTVLQVPLLHNQLPFGGGESYLKSPTLPYFRLPKWQNIERNDPVVFNWPAGDSTVYDVVNSYAYDGFNIGWKKIPTNTLTTRPVDKRDHYVKRCLAVAGDTLEIKNKQIFVNGILLPNPKNVQYAYDANDIAVSELSASGVNVEDRGGPSTYFMNDATVAMLKAKGKKPVPVEKHKTIELFPHDTTNFKGWTIDDYGKIWIPKAGVTIPISMENIALYTRIIGVYENNKLEFKDGKILINGAEANNYTFKQNYYWMMGDNRHNSQDSRYWGFVPEDHIVGKPLFIFFSLKNGSFSKGILWNRFFTSAYQVN
jgi:signal peptidase I